MKKVLTMHAKKKGRNKRALGREGRFFFFFLQINTEENPREEPFAMDQLALIFEVLLVFLSVNSIVQ